MHVQHYVPMLRTYFIPVPLGAYRVTALEHMCCDDIDFSDIST